MNRSSFALFVALLIHFFFIILFWFLGSITPEIKKPVQDKEKRIKISLKAMRSSLEHKLVDPMLPRKASKRVILPTVPQTDTGRQGEYPKALERTLVKELCKMTP